MLITRLDVNAARLKTYIFSGGEMKEPEAREAIKDRVELHKVKGGDLIISMALGYLEAIEKAKAMEEVLRRISKMKADFGYRSPEQQDFKLTSLIVNYGHWADDALSKFEEYK